jgi:hypothetical protein
MRIMWSLPTFRRACKVTSSLAASHERRKRYGRFEVLTAVLMKTKVF